MGTVVPYVRAGAFVYSWIFLIASSTTTYPPTFYIFYGCISSCIASAFNMRGLTLYPSNFRFEQPCQFGVEIGAGILFLLLSFFFFLSFFLTKFKAVFPIFSHICSTTVALYCNTRYFYILYYLSCSEISLDLRFLCLYLFRGNINLYQANKNNAQFTKNPVDLKYYLHSCFNTV